MESVYEDLINIVGEKNISKDEDMSKHTTFRAGGKAKYFVEPENEKQLSELIKYHNENNLKYYVIGNGSNVLVRDSGFDGTIIRIMKNFDNIEIAGERITCGGGAFLSKLSQMAAVECLTGLEFASGIPGTVGGGVAMNAGAYGGEIKDIIKSAKVMDKEGNIVQLTKDEMELEYRNSLVLKKELLVLSAVFELEKGDRVEIMSQMQQNMKARREKQPLEYPSAGSTFKRPEGYFAGKLIMDAGLQGFSVNGAQVSKKHCGFVINRANATAGDIIELMRLVSETVYEKFGVTLEPEVRIIGEE